MSKRKKSNTDPDYIDGPPAPKERRYPTNAVINQNATLLDQHADFIIDLMAKRDPKRPKATGPTWIASSFASESACTIKLSMDARFRTGTDTESEQARFRSPGEKL